jgi:hypothetical protein
VAGSSDEVSWVIILFNLAMAALAAATLAPALDSASKPTLITRRRLAVQIVFMAGNQADELALGLRIKNAVDAQLKARVGHLWIATATLSSLR